MQTGPMVRPTGPLCSLTPLQFNTCRVKHLCSLTLLQFNISIYHVGMWNDLPYTVFDTGTLDGFKGAVNRWFEFLRVNFSKFTLSCVFFSFPRRMCLWGCESNLWITLFFKLGPVLLVLIIIIIIHLCSLRPLQLTPAQFNTCLV